MDWKELIEALGAALAQVEDSIGAGPGGQQQQQQQQEQEQEQEQEEPAAAAAAVPNNEPNNAAVQSAVQTMNHKLIEIHSRLKSFDEEASEIPPASTGSQVLNVLQVQLIEGIFFVSLPPCLLPAAASSHGPSQWLAL